MFEQGGLTCSIFLLFMSQPTAWGMAELGSRFLELEAENRRLLDLEGENLRLKALLQEKDEAIVWLDKEVERKFDRLVLLVWSLPMVFEWIRFFTVSTRASTQTLKDVERQAADRLKESE